MGLGMIYRVCKSSGNFLYIEEAEIAPINTPHHLIPGFYIGHINTVASSFPEPHLREDEKSAWIETASAPSQLYDAYRTIFVTRGV